jgi:hypothetical protein
MLRVGAVELILNGMVGELSVSESEEHSSVQNLKKDTT